MSPYYFRFVIIFLAGFYLLIAGSLDLFSFGKKTIKTDPVFLRVSGLLMMAAYGAVWFGGTALFITLLVLAIASLLLALIRGVTQ